MIFLYKFLLISISYMVLLHSARTANATFASAPPRLSPRRRFAVRSAHSARTLALLVRSPARPGRARGLCGVANAPLSARSLWSHADPLARLMPRSPHAHASLWSHGLFKWCRFAPNKKHKEYIVSKLLKYNYDIFIQVFIYKY